MFKCQTELERKIQSEQTLKKNKLNLKVLFFRDYMAKIQLTDETDEIVAVFILYYSPKRNQFSVVFEKRPDQKTKILITQSFEGEKLIESGCKSAKKAGVKYEAYVDGSYIDSKTGYGAIILEQGIPIKKINGRVEKSDGLRQVTGELRATVEVIEYCKQNDIREIAIFYDYTGIKEWATDVWKANNPITKTYKAYMQKTSVKITWNKVKAHSGTVFNEMADILAKKGAKGIE